jgi:hypothetical protein
MPSYVFTDWRLPADVEEKQKDPYYQQIVKWFADFPGSGHVYSLHNMIQCGMKYDKFPGMLSAFELFFTYT